MRECTAEPGHPSTWPEYLAWVNHPEVRARFGRRPRSYGVLTRLAGTWPNTLRAAGVIPGDPDHGVVTRLGLRRTEYRASDENLQEGIREVAQRLGRSPRVQEYMRERERIYEETLAAGAARAVLTMPPTVQSMLDAVAVNAVFRLAALWLLTAHALIVAKCASKCRVLAASPC